MKKKQSFIIICMLLIAINLQAQCTIDNIFPVKPGFTKFKSTTTIAQNSNIREDNESYKYDVSNNWIDSYGYKHSNFYYLYTIPCLSVNNNKLRLQFANDHLYKINIELRYSKEEFDKCMETYNLILNLYKKHYFYVGVNTISNYKDEKIGEGENFNLYPANKRKDYNNIEITYKIVYEWKSIDGEKYDFTGNVDHYLINISYSDLAGTKLKNDL